MLYLISVTHINKNNKPISSNIVRDNQYSIIICNYSSKTNGNPERLYESETDWNLTLWNLIILSRICKDCMLYAYHIMKESQL